MTADEQVNELAAELASFARMGAYDSLSGGVMLILPGSTTAKVSLSDIQEAADLFPDDQMRARIQQRIGLAPYIHMSQRERNELFAKSCGQSKWANVPRSEQDRPLRLLARRLLGPESVAGEDGIDASYTPYNRWDVLEYEVHNVLPEGAIGTATQTHWRRIRSNVEGLTEFRLAQNSNWTSGRMPTYKMITGGEYRLENVRETVEDGYPGFRFDFVVDIEPLALGEPADIRWIREYEHLPGDLGGDESASMVIASLVRVHHAVMTVKFPRDHPPSEVWEISNLPNQDRTIQPAQRRPIVPKRGLFTAEFFDLAVGYASGIGWSWGTSTKDSD